MGESYVGRKVFAVIMAFVVLFMATSLLRAVAYGQAVKIALIVVGTGVAAWAFLAREYWWLLLPAVVSFGGYFYFGFKIMAHEIGLLLCLLPLPLSLATAQSTVRQRRLSLSPSVFLLLGYLVAHLGASAFLAITHHTGGLGSILRVYMHGIWPLAFLIPFYYFGDTKHLKKALALMYLAAILRVILGAIALAFPDILYIPGVNFVLPATASGGTDLRVSSLFLVSFSMCYYAMSRSIVAKVVNVLVIMAATIFVLLGAGRIGMVMFFGYIFFFMLIQKYRFILMFAALAFVCVVGGLNVNPDVLYNFPRPIRRTLSALVLDSRYHAIHKETRLSNEWHFELARRGQQRWLESPRSFFVGQRVMPFTEAYRAHSANFFSRLEIAAQMGTYEAGLWTVLGVTGVVGLVLYLWVLHYLCRGLLPALWKNGIADHLHAFYFLGILNVTIWLVFAWIAGHFPGNALMLAAIARSTYDTEKRREMDKIATE